MKKQLPLLIAFLFSAFVGWSQVVTTVSNVNICSGPTTVQIPVRVSSFNAVGSISLKLSYVNSEITSPSVVYKDPGLDTWGTFQTSFTTPGTIIISAYDPDVTPPVTGLTLTDNTILFTLQFTIGTITNPAPISFVENTQGTSCEYGGIGPDYTPFLDTPTSTYYIDGSVTIVADPTAPGLTKNPADGNVCAGQTLTVTTTAGSGGAGTITDEYSYTTNGTNWSAWSTSIPSFSAVVGINSIRSRRTATGTGCDESSYNTVSWTVVADPVAPGITKNPADANVCAGQTLTVTTSSGSGGTGTIADEYSYSTDGTNWSAWSVSVPSFAAVVGTNSIRSRRTATGTGCNESSWNEVSWTVVADPVAPGITKNPATASVCAGETLTVTTTPGSGGTGTIADEYRYSTNNGSSWSTWSASVPSFASVAGTNLIQSRRTASGTGCNESTWNEVSWTVNAKQKISGTINYYKSSGNVLMNDEDITVELYKSSDEAHTTLIATTVSDENGYFEFPSICPDCDYDIVATSTHATEGAVNTTDAAQANYWGPNAYAIEKVRFHAGDVVGPDRFIGGVDAARIQQNFVNGTTFDKAAWTFWRSGFSILHNPLVIEPEFTEYYPNVTLAVGSDATANMYALVTGDFNRSFNPNLTKAASTSLTLYQTGNRLAGTGQEIELPVRMISDANIGAVSLVFDFPASLADLLNVTLPSENGTLQWVLEGDELRISWMAPVAMNLSAGEPLLMLSLKTKPAFTGDKTISITLAADPLNELADATYEVIGDAAIGIETISSNALDIYENQNSDDIGLFCYPNPADDFVLFSYSHALPGKVTLDLHNMLGFRIATIISESSDAGDHFIKYDTGFLPSGVYTATLYLETGKNKSVKTIKLILR